MLSRLSKYTFDPGARFQPTPGLTERMQMLTGNGKLRTALDELLAILARDPSNQEALWHANIVVGMQGRTTHLQAAEPLSKRYLFDTRLDPLYATCGKCQTAWIPGTSALLQFYKTQSVMGAAGYQCTSCGFIVCRKCVPTTRIGLDLLQMSTECPDCRKNTLSPLVRPNGRLPLQLPRRQAPVKVVLVYRQGPLPPDSEYITRLLDERSPDALDDDAQLIGSALSDWPSDSGQILQGAIARLAVTRFDVEAGEMLDDYGQRVYLVKSFALPQAPSRPLAARRSAPPLADEARAAADYQHLLHELHESAAADKRDPEELIGACVTNHLERILTQHQDSPALGRAVAEWSILVEPANFRWTCAALSACMYIALRDGISATKARRAGNIHLVATALPLLEPDAARRYFENGYTAFLETQGFWNPLLTTARAHWVLCGSGKRIAIHLTHLPRDTKAIATAALDLMDAIEKRNLGF